MILAISGRAMMEEKVSTGIRILVVDDHPTFLRAFLQYLCTDPAMLITGKALTGLDALELAALLRPDVVLVDLAIPGINGLEVTKRLKKELDAPRVIILTVYDHPKYRAQAQLAGADGFVAKSQIDEEFLSLIHRLCDGDRSGLDTGG
jgi:DNA-binding NarL/FixJ family response regulator